MDNPCESAIRRMGYLAPLCLQGLTSGHAHNPKRFRPRHDRIGQRRIRRLLRQVLSAGKEPDERPALMRDVIADRAAQHGILDLQRVQN